ncbi:MAG: hypothetical protein ABIO44_14375, partial [Saprospiraceae bacterium]
MKQCGLFSFIIFVLIFLAKPIFSQQLDSILYSRYLPDSTVRTKNYLKAYELYINHFKKYPNCSGGFTYFNAACVASKVNHLDSAQFFLLHAIASGSDDKKSYLEDSDLESLRQSKYNIEILNAYSDAQKNQMPINLMYMDSMLKVMAYFDQEVRVGLSTNRIKDSTAFLSFILNSKLIDSTNGVLLKIFLNRIDKDYYIDLSNDFCFNLFLILQHSNDQSLQCEMLSFVEKLVVLEKLPNSSYALLFDRIESRKNNKQLYGTQIKYNFNTNKNELIPIYNIEGINFRRKIFMM